MDKLTVKTSETDFMIPYKEVVGHLAEKHRLTKKETKVFKEIIVSGPDKVVVGIKLKIAPSTAYLHFKRIYEKLDVDGMSQLFHLVIRTHEELIQAGQAESSDTEILESTPRRAK